MNHKFLPGSKVSHKEYGSGIVATRRENLQYGFYPDMKGITTITHTKRGDVTEFRPFPHFTIVQERDLQV